MKTKLIAAFCLFCIAAAEISTEMHLEMKTKRECQVGNICLRDRIQILLDRFVSLLKTYFFPNRESSPVYTKKQTNKQNQIDKYGKDK